MTDDRIWILRAGINDDICGTFSSRENAEKQGWFLHSCGELSSFTVKEYVPVGELAEATKRAVEWQEMHGQAIKAANKALWRVSHLENELQAVAIHTAHTPAAPRELLVSLLESCARIANRAFAEGEDTRG